jgi:tetratricopeptide (TPR) repeat protein
MINWVARLLRRPVGPAATEPADSAAVRSVPDEAFSVLYDRGRAAFKKGLYADAVRDLQTATERNPDCGAEVYCCLGMAQHRIDMLEEAADALTMALCFAPEMGPAHLALALVERKQGKPKAALESVGRAIAYGETGAAAHNLSGALLLELGDENAAIASFERAVATDPNDPAGHSNLGYVLFRDRGEYDRGAEHIERALALDPNNLDARCNHTLVLSHRGEYQRALELCDEILAKRPGLNEVKLNRALTLLKLGRFDCGWDDYEARQLVRSNFNARGFPCPGWDGESLRGKTVLVHGEQGLGDEIMFASCIHEVIARADHCVIECAPVLERLFRRSFAQATVFAGEQTGSLPRWWTQAPTIDLHVASGSLPRHFRRSIGEFCDHDGYLVADPVRVARWRERLAALGPGLKVGISWRGGMQSTRRNLRSIDLRAWMPMLQDPRMRFVSLQYGDTADERTAASHELGSKLCHWQEAIDDMDEMAALVVALDIVVSVCTAVIHLAGALGRPVLVLVPTCAEWRYQSFGETLPWYPTARLLRQQSAGTWHTEIESAARVLQDLALADHVQKADS